MLEQHLSMSPCSLALAFDSSLMRDANTAKGVNDYMRQYGNIRVQYRASTSSETNGDDTLKAADTKRMGFFACNGPVEEV
jgi:hypothetical protein